MNEGENFYKVWYECFKFGKNLSCYRDAIFSSCSAYEVLPKNCLQSVLEMYTLGMNAPGFDSVKSQGNFLNISI